MIVAVDVNLRFVWIVLKLFVKRRPLLLPLGFTVLDGGDSDRFFPPPPPVTDGAGGPVVH